MAQDLNPKEKGRKVPVLTILMFFSHACLHGVPYIGKNGRTIWQTIVPFYSMKKINMSQNRYEVV